MTPPPLTPNLFPYTTLFRSILSGATPRFVKLRTPDWSFDEEELSAAFGPHTKAIILNTPNNPTGKVFTRAERSEEHTSELQSLTNLVCRLLLEKKNSTTRDI